MGRWYGTVVRDVEDCIREAAARGRGRDFYDIVFTSELPCNPIRTHSCLTIQQFIRSSAHSSHGGNTRMCAINAPCVARNKCTLERLCSRSNPPADIQYAASTQYMPYSTFLPGLVRAFFFRRLIPTYYEIDKDGGRTQHAGVFHSGPISLQLPALHMQSSQSVSESAAQARGTRGCLTSPPSNGLARPTCLLPRYLPTYNFTWYYLPRWVGTRCAILSLPLKGKKKRKQYGYDTLSVQQTR